MDTLRSRAGSTALVGQVLERVLPGTLPMQEQPTLVPAVYYLSDVCDEYIHVEAGDSLA